MQLSECIRKITVDPTTPLGSTVLASVIEHKVKGEIKVKAKGKNDRIPKKI